jgi:hypothetical protein
MLFTHNVKLQPFSVLAVDGGLCGQIYILASFFSRKGTLPAHWVEGQGCPTTFHIVEESSFEHPCGEITK